MKRRGFTIVELLIVITIMGVLLVLAVASLRGSQANSRDAERKADAESIGLHLDNYYTNGSDTSLTVGKYPSTSLITGSEPGTPVAIQVLVVGGGGGGGGSETNPAGDAAGGGGAGGYIYNSSFTAATQAYTVTVGNGGNGAAGNTNGAPGSIGGNSTFGILTALGGGAGAAQETNGGAGGSGGGAGGSCNTGNKTGGATNGQGYKGQDNIDSTCTYRGGSGGGGAGSIGGYNLYTGAGGVGGNGVTNSISGSPITYAGGGGGGAGRNVGNLGGLGINGGGSGGSSPSGNGGNATANTGGGGGAAGAGTGTGGNGGSGIVIVSYPTGTLTATGGTITTINGNTVHTFTTSGTFTVFSFTSNGIFTINDLKKTLRDIDIASLAAPGIVDSSGRPDPTRTFKAAVNNTQTTAGVLPQPTVDQYIYQPIMNDGTLCTLESQECRKFNLYYRLEVANISTDCPSPGYVCMLTGKNQ